MNPKSLVSGHVDSGAYTDLNRLSSLKHGDRDSEGNIRKVAQEFESLFVSEMFKASRKASDVLADEENPMNSDSNSWATLRMLPSLSRSPCLSELKRLRSV